VRKLTLAVSDVPPARLDALASGPTLPDPTTVADCREILARYALLDRFPPSVRCFFESGALPETPKPGELDSPVTTLFDASELARAARSRAEASRFHAVIDNTCDDWPYDRAADYLLARLRELRRMHPRCCLISAGEISVPVPHLSDSGSHMGGRNQHLVLYLATKLRHDDGPIAVLSAGSDGIDGNSVAAGAVVDTQTIDDTFSSRNRESALRALATFDSSSWLAAAGATILTGPSGQNLRDLRILLAGATG
jgi:hydroxypyruvate reductase